jgi:molecular chaperone Hsp33
MSFREAQDQLIRWIATDDTLRVITATTTTAVGEAAGRRNRVGVEAVALGRALTAGYLLATLAKQDDERLRIHIAGGGPLGAVLVDVHGDGRGRASTTRRIPTGHPARALPADGRPSIADAVGRGGALTITRDLGLGNPYQGSVTLESAEVDEDLQRYLDASEQLPSALACAVRLDAEGRVLRSAGVLVQSFPGAPSELIEAARARLAGGVLWSLLSTPRDHVDLAGVAMGGAMIRPMQEVALRFECPCGPERALRVLATLGADDVERLAGERDEVEVTCEFCGSVERLVSDDLIQLAQSIRAIQS